MKVGIARLLLLAVVSFGAIQLLGGSTAYAATTPDSCFTLTGNVITDYDETNLACPKDVEIPGSISATAVVGIGDATFQNNQLTSVTIPNGITAIGNYAFSTNQLTSINIPNTVTSLGDGAFNDNQLASLVIPTSITTLNSYVFSTNQLTSVTIPSSIVSINEGAFSSNQLTSIAIPDTVATLGSQAFTSNQLTSVSLPDGLTSIESNTFSYNKLASLTIPASITSIDATAFLLQSSLGRDIYDEFLSGDSVRIQAAYDEIFYSRLYTPGATSQVSKFVTEASFFGFDLNNNGTDTDSLGGHLINPAQVTVSYTAEDGPTVSPTVNSTGVGLSSYLTEENSANDLSLYYQRSSVISLTAPAIIGYQTITPVSPYAMTLSAADGNNTLNFVYSNPSSDDDDNDTTVAIRPESSTPLAPDTGVDGETRGEWVAKAGLIVSGGLFLGLAIAARKWLYR